MIAHRVAAQAAFNIAFLFQLNDFVGKHEDLQKFVRQEYERGLRRGPDEPIHLVNPVHFLGFGYFCLVWLWEACRRDGSVACILGNAQVAECLSSVEATGPREVRGVEQKLRLIRNALAHGRVRVEPLPFLFSDRAPNEPAETSVEMSQERLGDLCMAVIGAVLDAAHDEV